MTWIRTQMRPQKICVENPDYPVSSVFTGYDLKLSGGTKQAGIMAAAMILAGDVDTVIEIGIQYGFTSLILAKALASNARDGLLVSVDINPNAVARSKKITDGLPITHRHIVGDSKLIDYGPYLNGRSVGLSFIDGAHDYESCAHDIRACHEITRPWGILVAHDYNAREYDGVYRAVNEHCARTGDAMFILDHNRRSQDYRTAIIQKGERK